MVKILKIFAYSLFFILALIYFVPKVNLYHYIETKLQSQKVIFSNEEIKDNSFSLSINNIEVSYESIQSANIQSIEIHMFLLYNSISLKNIELSSVISSFIPLHIDSVEVKYSIFNPMNLVINASGEFGEAKGKFSILDRNLTMQIEPSELMLKGYKSTLNNLSKNETGEYSYDKTF